MNEISDVLAQARRLYLSVHRFDIAAAERLGVNESDLRCLTILDDGALTPGDIGERLGLTSGSVTALIDRLERRGFVERRRSAEDRRSVTVHLLPDAHASIDAIYEALRAQLQAMLGEVTRFSTNQAAAVLDAASAGFEAATLALPGPKPV